MPADKPIGQVLPSPADNNTSSDTRKQTALTVRLLESGAGTLTTELLGLAATVVGNEESTVVLSESSLEGVLGVLVNELLVVGNQGLGNGLTDGVDLGSVTTTGDADTDVNTGELVKTNNEERLVDLCSVLVCHFKHHFATMDVVGEVLFFLNAEAR